MAKYGRREIADSGPTLTQQASASHLLTECPSLMQQPPSPMPIPTPQARVPHSTATIPSPVRTKTVVTSIIEKALINLDVLSKIEVGDKLGWTSNGHFVIQKPGYWTTAMRVVNRSDRWVTLNHIQDVISTAETMDSVQVSERLRAALHVCIHGIRNLQLTYDGDELMTSSLTVLLHRLGERYGLEQTDLM